MAFKRRHVIRTSSSLVAKTGLTAPSFLLFLHVVMKPIPNSRIYAPTSVRFTPSELVEVATACEALRVSRSTLLRRGALAISRELQEALPR